MPDDKIKKQLEAEIAKKKLQESLRMGKSPATGMTPPVPTEDEKKKKKKKGIIEGLKEFIYGPEKALKQAGGQ